MTGTGRNGSPRDPADVLRRLSDRVELCELVDRYLASLDEGVFDDAWARSLFTDDAELSYPVGSHRGTAGLVGFTADIMGRWQRTHHHGSNHLVSVAGDAASLRWNLLAVHVPVGAPPPPASVDHFYLGGKFTAEAVRTTDGWRFRRLQLRVVWTSGSPAPEVPSIAAGTDFVRPDVSQ